MEEWRYRSTIFDLVTRWRWVISFRPWPLYPREKGSRYPLDRRLGGPQIQSGLYEEKNLAKTGIETRPTSPLYRLSYPEFSRGDACEENGQARHSLTKILNAAMYCDVYTHC
jgi:hypothetical protein